MLTAVSSGDAAGCTRCEFSVLISGISAALMA
jgi:hypothetical protein